MTPRLRRFLLLVLIFAAYMAFTVLTPLRLWAGVTFALCLAMLLWLFWQMAKEPFPWRLPWRRP